MKIHSATVETVGVTIRTIMVGNRNMTKTIYNQIPTIDALVFSGKSHGDFDWWGNVFIDGHEPELIGQVRSGKNKSYELRRGTYHRYKAEGGTFKVEDLYSAWQEIINGTLYDEIARGSLINIQNGTRYVIWPGSRSAHRMMDYFDYYRTLPQIFVGA